MNFIKIIINLLFLIKCFNGYATIDQDLIDSFQTDEYFIFIDIDGTLISTDIEILKNIPFRSLHGPFSLFQNFYNEQWIFYLKLKNPQEVMQNSLRPGVLEILQFLSSLSNINLIFYSHGSRYRNENLIASFNQYYRLNKKKALNYSLYSFEDEPSGSYVKNISYFLKKEIEKKESLDLEKFDQYLKNSVLIDDQYHLESANFMFQIGRFETDHCYKKFDWLSCNELFILIAILEKSFFRQSSFSLAGEMNFYQMKCLLNNECKSFAEIGIYLLRKISPSVRLIDVEPVWTPWILDF